jgi:hypothetical protein
MSLCAFTVSAQQTYFPTSIPPSSISFTPTYRFIGTDSLAKFYLSNSGRWSQFYTAAQANAIFLRSIATSNGLSGNGSSGSPVILGGTLTGPTVINYSLPDSLKFFDPSTSSGLFFKGGASGVINIIENNGSFHTTLGASAGSYSFQVANGSNSAGLTGSTSNGLGIIDQIKSLGIAFAGDYTTNQRLQRLSVPSVGTTIALIDSVKGTISGGVSHANNGVSLNGDTVQLGGTLTKNTIVTGAGHSTSITTDNGTSTSESDVSPNSIFTGTTVDSGGNSVDFSTLYSGGVLVADMEINTGAGAKRIEMAQGGGGAGIVVTDGIDNVGLTGNALFPKSGDPNQYAQFGNLTGLDSTIYKTDGSITGNRTVDIGDNTLNFSSTSDAFGNAEIKMAINSGGDTYGNSNYTLVPWGNFLQATNPVSGHNSYMQTEMNIGNGKIDALMRIEEASGDKQILLQEGLRSIQILNEADSTGMKYATSKTVQKIGIDTLDIPHIGWIQRYVSTHSGGTTTHPLTLSYGLTGTSFDGATAVTTKVDTSLLQTILNFFPKADTRYVKTSALLNHVAGYGLSGSNYNTSTSQTWLVDTTAISTKYYAGIVVGADGVVSGMVTTTVTTTATTTAGTYRLNNALITKGGSTNTTIDAQNATLNRYDLIVGDASGVLSMVQGALNADAVEPAIPANKTLIASIYIPATGGTVTTTGGGSGKGTVTKVTSATTDILIANQTTTPVLTLNKVNGVAITYYDPISSIQTQLNGKQATLVSGTNIKTINSVSLLGSGNIVISGSTQVYSEIPTGTINGSNTSFTIAHIPLAGISLFLNGLMAIPTTDYSVSGTTITMVTAPISGDNLMINYSY